MVILMLEMVLLFCVHELYAKQSHNISEAQISKTEVPTYFDMFDTDW